MRCQLTPFFPFASRFFCSRLVTTLSSPAVVRSLDRILPVCQHLLQGVAVNAEACVSFLPFCLVSFLWRCPHMASVGWQPMTQDDFGDCGVYPGCHVAQYPLDIGRKKVSCALGQNIQHVPRPAFIRLLRETPSRYKLD